MVRYLRVSVTDRCNLGCSYCAPHRLRSLSPRGDLLSYEEIAEVVSIAASLGVTKVRITGGEPLVRHDIGTLLGSLSTIDGLSTLGLTTNGVLLKQHIPVLVRSRFRRINVSLDTLNPRKYRALCGSSRLDTVLSGIEGALDAGLQVKLNAVCWPGFEISDAVELVDYGLTRGMDVRFIEAMQVLGAESVPTDTMNSVFAALASRWSLSPAGRNGAARLFDVMDSSGRIGIIEPSSTGFCEGCDRLRLSSTGMLRTCLFSRDGIDLRDRVRRRDRSSIEALLRSAICRKEASASREGSIVQSMMGIGG